MTFQQLQYILEVGKTRSVSTAARNLIVSSSSVSISVSSLEKELGYPLFLRTQKGLVPTDQGKLVLDYAEQICSTYALLNAVGREPVRTIRICSTDQDAVARAYAQLIEENRHRTDVRIINTSYTGEEIYHKMVGHEIELSVSTLLSYSLGYWEKRLRKGGLHRQILKTVPAVVQVGPGHRLYHEKIVSPHDLRNESLVDNPHNPLSQSGSFGGSLYVDPNRVLFASRPGIRQQLLLRGLGYSIGVMPPKGKESILRCIPLAGAYFHFSAITNTQTPAQPEIMRFLQIVKHNLDEAYPDKHTEKKE